MGQAMWGSDKRAIVDLGKRFEQVQVFFYITKPVLFGKVSKAALFAESRCVRMSPRCKAGEARCTKCLFKNLEIDSTTLHCMLWPKPVTTAETLRTTVGWVVLYSAVVELLGGTEAVPVAFFQPIIPF